MVRDCSHENISTCISWDCSQWRQNRGSMLFNVKGSCLYRLQLWRKDGENQTHYERSWVTFDHKLRWTVTLIMSAIKSKACCVVWGWSDINLPKSKLKVLSILYYPTPVWLTLYLMAPEMRRLEPIHFGSFRVIIKDDRQRGNREWISHCIQRLPHRQRSKFVAASLAIKIWQTRLPGRILTVIFEI